MKKYSQPDENMPIDVDITVLATPGPAANNMYVDITVTGTTNFDFMNTFTTENEDVEFFLRNFRRDRAYVINRLMYVIIANKR